MSYPWKTEGESITLVAAAAWTEGDIVVIGDLVGVAGNTVGIGENLCLHLYGELTLPKAAGLGIAIGDLVFWDAVNDEVTKTATDAFMGKATSAAAGGAATVDVVLTPGASLDDGTNAGLIAGFKSTSPVDELNVKKVAKGRFSVGAGKGIAVHTFGPALPDNAIITRAWYEVVTTFTSATDAGTIALGVQTDSPAGILAAIAISNGGNPYDAGLHDGLPVNTSATAIKTGAAGRLFVATVAVEALTAGVLDVYAEYVVGA